MRSKNHSQNQGQVSDAQQQETNIKLAWKLGGMAVLSLVGAICVTVVTRDNSTSVSLDATLRKTLSKLSAQEQVHVALGGTAMYPTIIQGIPMKQPIDGSAYKIVLRCTFAKDDDEKVISTEDLFRAQRRYTEYVNQGLCAATPA